jgi:hypothetical protein
MTIISSMFSSWKEYYLSKKKETNGFLNKLTENKISLDVPLSFVNDSIWFKRAVEENLEENFLLLAAGGNRVRIVHNCFTSEEEQQGMTEVFRDPRHQVHFTFQTQQHRSSSEAHLYTQSHEEVRRREGGLATNCQRILGLQECR